MPLKFTAAGYYTINLQFFAGFVMGVASYEGEFDINKCH